MLIVCCFLPHIHCDAHPLRDKCCTSTKVLGLVGWYDSNEGYWQDSYLRRFDAMTLLHQVLELLVNVYKSLRIIVLEATVIGRTFAASNTNCSYKEMDTFKRKLGGVHSKSVD
ncbi:uncharacterized protein LOC142172856 isoform X2 [Nicotiana tabacum]|uniref:Uncharacterized protein LOC142172856 isoform X2 n=1 Tax=Nicotiana tabacum TaxID=4097 RepID=A0AC58T5X5_TOBAC|nr:uncharacterized protein LOC104108571 isoform X3 [Nicotiana tomentosiformis]